MKLGLNIQTALLLLVIVLVFGGGGSMLSSRAMSVFAFGCDRSDGNFKCNAASPLKGSGISVECRKSARDNKRGFACSVDIERLQSKRNQMSHDATKDVNPRDL